jgi:hypothetical protein
MAKRPEEMIADMIASLKAKTGRSLEEWQPIIKAKGVTKHGEVVSFLKSEHGLTHGFANMIALQTLKAPAPEGDPIDAMYSGAKQAVRPIHDALMAKIMAFGPDVDVAPKKGYISLRRSKQFALIQPSTPTRVDVGINLKGREPAGRLEASGSFNAMFSHRVRVGSAAEVDDELIGWLRAAYDQA